MAKKIKAIKCPHCGSVNKAKSNKNTYQCNQCDTEYFIDSDDLNINVNHTYNNDNQTSAKTEKNGWYDFFSIALAMLFIGLIIFFSRSCFHSRPSSPLKIDVKSELNIKAPEIVKQVEAGVQFASDIKHKFDHRAINASKINLGCYTSLTPGCNKLFITRLSFLTTKKGLNLNILNNKTWQILIDNHAVTSLTDWLNLSQSQLISINGIGNRQAKLIYEQIELAKKKPFSQWLQGLEFLDIPEYIDQYNWQQISQWSISDWQKKLSVSKSKAMLYKELTNSDEIKTIASNLQQLEINGF